MEGLFFCSGIYTFLLDTDQYPQRDLIKEIIEQNSDAIIIPERTLDARSFIGKLLDENRKLMERLQVTRNDPEIPSIPRVYRTLIIKEAFQKIDSNTLDSVIQHEDSIIYFESNDAIDSLFYAKHVLFNKDPTIIEYIKKSLGYGFSVGYLNTRLIPHEYVALLHKLDRNRFSLLLQNRGIPAFLATLLKGVPYMYGVIAGKLLTLLRERVLI